MDVKPHGLVGEHGEVEALALVLRALIDPEEPAPAYDEYGACLGVSVAPVTVKGESHPLTWPSFGRDVHLETVARVYGLRLRNLHPPDVGVDMARAEEFDQHFELSYKPLIRRAIEHDQPVIAWRGWEGEDIPSWGVVTEIAGDAFAGHVAISGQKTALSASAWQCYVVEVCEPRRPSLETKYQLALRDGTDMLRGGTTISPPRTPQSGMFSENVALGLNAWSVWRERLGSIAASPEQMSDEATRSAWEGVAQYLLHSRRSAARFWERMAREAETSHAPSLRELQRACEVTVPVMEKLDGLTGGGEGVPSSSWIGELLEGLDQAVRQDERLLQAYLSAGRATVPP